MWYKVDYNKLVVMLLPLSLRRPRVISLARVLVSPLIDMHYLFTQRRNDNLYQLAHNGQVCFLRKALNDKFDRTERRIWIGEGNQFNRKYVYQEIENKPVFLGKEYIHNDSDYSDQSTDFIVNVPFDNFNLFEMQYLIDFYKLAAKKYKIHTPTQII